MLKYLLLALVLIQSLRYNAQNPDFWVLLTDKTNTPYSLNDPDEFLSQRSLDRRVNQGINLDHRDLPVDPDYIQQVASLPGVEFRYASKWFNALSIRCDSSILEEVEAMPFVENIKSIQQLSPKSWPEDDRPIEIEFNTSPQRLPIEYGLSANQVKDLNGHVLHEQGYEGEGMVMAILDSGFDRVDSMGAFSALFDESRIISTRDFVDIDDDVYIGHSHGRFVLSCIAGIKEGQAYGTAVNASFHLLRTEDTASETTIEEFNWIAGAEYADSVGADVLNTSLGYTNFDSEAESYTYEDMDGNTTWITRGADIAASRGMLVVNSAGNSGAGDFHFIGAPADGDSVLTVGSIDADSSHTNFSSFGPSFDGRVKPNICAQGRASIAINGSNEVQPVNGTSFSSPILAGLATCLWQAVPHATNMDVFHAIEMSADLYNAPNDSLGYGIPNFGAALEILQELASGIEEIEIDEFLAYPNPAFQAVNLLSRDVLPMSYIVQVIDLRGALAEIPMRTISQRQVQMDVRSLSAGQYIIRVIHDEESTEIPFIKR